MAWWNTHYDLGSGTWITRSAGKQPAWLNYMTNVNKTYGNFAIENNEMFMTLNRRYEMVLEDPEVSIDVETKFRHIFPCLLFMLGYFLLHAGAQVEGFFIVVFTIIK